MASISNFLSNVKNLIAKYHYTKTQSDAKYVAIDDLNSAIEAELTPAQVGYNVSVSITDESNNEEDLFVILTDGSTDYSVETNIQAVSNNSASFTGVEAGTYNVLLVTNEYNKTIVGLKSITVSADSSVSFTIRDVAIHKYSDNFGEQNSDANNFAIYADEDGVYTIEVMGSALLADGTYYPDDRLADDASSITIDSNNTTIVFYVEEQQDPEDIEGY